MPSDQSLGMWTDQKIGLALAVSSSIFIGTSFIIKKRGLRIAGSSGLRAGAGGFSYLQEPVWWAGMTAMIVGEVANFSAYAFAPAILVTPLGALSIIVSAVLAHYILKERLNLFGIMGCVLCINGSITIVLHAPPEREVSSVVEVWSLAMQPGFLLYALAALALILYLIWFVAPEHGTTNILVYIAICSLAGSFSVISCKALGIALKLTFQGDNQLNYMHFGMKALYMHETAKSRVPAMHPGHNGMVTMPMPHAHESLCSSRSGTHKPLGNLAATAGLADATRLWQQQSNSVTRHDDICVAGL